jgi:hypothetical protein
VLVATGFTRITDLLDRWESGKYTFKNVGDQKDAWRFLKFLGYPRAM